MKKLATDEQNRALVDAQYNAALQRHLLQGIVGGAGAVGLYHLLRKAKKKIDTLVPPKPDYNELATAMPSPAQLKLSSAADIAKAVAYPLAGAGAGALFGAATGKKKDRLRRALVGGAAGGAAGGLGALVGTEAGGQALSQLRNALPSPYSVFGLLSSGGTPLPTHYDGASTEAQLKTLMPILAGTGAVGGGYLTHKLLGEDKQKEEENKNNIEKSRKEYFDMLLADEKNASTLDDAFHVYKQANPSKDPFSWTSYFSHLGPEIGKWLGYIPDALHSGRVTLDSALTAGMLGAGAVGAKYMYDRTKRRDNATHVDAARKARARMAGGNNVWIDPQELALVKQIAEKNQQEQTANA